MTDATDAGDRDEAMPSRNPALRAAHEDIRSRNVALTSANVELHTINDELNALNSELNTLNDEIRDKVDQLTTANSDLKNFFASTQLAVIVVAPDLVVRNYTDAARRLFALSTADRGRPLAEIAIPIADRGYLDEARRCAETGEEFESRQQSADGARDFHLKIMPYRRLDDGHDGATLIFTDITVPVGLERALGEERERLELAVEVAGVGIWEFDARRALFTMDDAERRLFGLAGDAPLSERAVLARILDEDRERVRGAQRLALETGRAYDQSFRVCGRNDEPRWLHSVGRAHFSADGPRLIGVSFDCTAEREAEATRELLLREMDHRIKNLFAVIGGMVAVSAREASDVRAFADDLTGRILAMGRAHALTQRSAVERPLVLAELIEAVIAPTRARQRITIEGPPLVIAQSLVTPLALIFHEWATNAAKYGALSAPDATLSVCWTNDRGRTRIEWAETGVDASGAAGGRSGFGTRLIEATARQLRATLGGDQGNGFFTRLLEFDGLAPRPGA